MPIFDPQNINAAVVQALHDADVGTDTNALVVVVTRNALGEVIVRGVYSQRFDNVWTISGALAIDHQGHIDGGVQVKATWT